MDQRTISDVGQASQSYSSIQDSSAKNAGNGSEATSQSQIAKKWLDSLKTEPSGLKYDQEKPRVDLLDPLALEGLARVLTFGAKKYAAHNWRGGISFCRLLGAALRHIFAILRGEDVDAESGLPHVDHLGCCWMFLSNMMKTRPDLDDRWKP